MNRDSLIKLLTEQRKELERLGVKSLALFGSAARDDAQAESDVDILVEFEGPATFNQYIELEFFLQDLLGNKVDLVTRKALKPRLRPYVEEEAIYVT